MYTWGIARALGGRVLLRLEDHDRSRCRPAYERALLEDCAWLGLRPDVGGIGGCAGSSPFRQSDNGSAYEAALARLRVGGHVFACACSRRDIALDASPAASEEPRYPGRCATRGLADTTGRTLRLQMPSGAVPFEDALLGPQEQDPAQQVGAVALRDRHGQWTYQLAVCVDDVRHGVDLVVRGRDLLASTGRQIVVMRLLGRAEPPVYLHHPLIYRADGTKVSKANRDAGVRDLRAAGRTAAEVFGLAAHAVGLVDEPREIAPEEFAALIAR